MIVAKKELRFNGLACQTNWGSYPNRFLSRYKDTTFF